MEGNKKIFDLEERAYQFASRVDDYVNKLPKTISNTSMVSSW